MGARFSVSVQTGPGVHPASCTMGTGSFPGVKRPGRGADHPPPSKCRGHERVELYLYSPSAPQWPVTGRTYPLKPVTPLFTTRLNIKKCNTPPKKCIYVILLISVKQPLLPSAGTMFSYNRDRVCLLCGTNCISEYSLDLFASLNVPCHPDMACHCLHLP